MQEYIRVAVDAMGEANPPQGNYKGPVLAYFSGTSRMRSSRVRWMPS